MGYAKGDAYRVVVGFDFTDLGYLALHGAINTAMATPGGELHVLGAVSPRFGLGPVQSGGYDGIAEAQAQLESIVGLALAERGAEHVPYHVHARASGAPSVAIVELAHEQDADFVVIGTHGRHGMDRLLHGSTAEHVVRDAPCPVLVMRHKTEHAEHETEPAEPSMLSDRSGFAVGSDVFDWTKFEP